MRGVCEWRGKLTTCDRNKKKKIPCWCWTINWGHNIVRFGPKKILGTWWDAQRNLLYIIFEKLKSEKVSLLDCTFNCVTHMNMLHAPISYFIVIFCDHRFLFTRCIIFFVNDSSYLVTLYNHFCLFLSPSLFEIETKIPFLHNKIQTASMNWASLIWKEK